MSAPRVTKIYRSPAGKPIATLRGPRSMAFDDWLVARKAAKEMARDGKDPEDIAILTGLKLVRSRNT